MTPDLKQLQELLAAATPGKWNVCRLPSRSGGQHEIGSDKFAFWIAKVGSPSTSHDDSYANAQLIVAMHEALPALLASHEALSAQVADMRARKDVAYDERNRMVAVLTKLFPASLERHPEEDLEWEDDWRWVVYIDSPAGQLSWHIHDRQVPMFEHLPRFQGRKWDGHTTEDKYKRLAEMPVQAAEVAGLRASLGAIMKLIGDGTLVRDISGDAEPGWAMKQLPLVMALKTAQELLDAAREGK